MATKKNKEDRFEQIGSKIDPAMAEVLDACCNALGVDIYHLLQWFCYVIVKASAPMHALDPRIQKLMTMLDRDAGWQNAFNLCNPDKLKVAQVILILEQEGHRGFGAVMVDKPWMGEMTNQTECVDDILERVAEVTMSGIYRRLRLMGAELECNNLSDILLTMLDAQDIANLDASNRAEGPQMGDIAPNGKAVAYGKRTKRKKHFSPDTMPVTGTLFDDIDHESPAPKLEDWEGEKLGTDSTD
jgi:hypothetical protein